MQWYATLVDKKNLRMREYLDHVRGAVLSMNDEDNKMDVDRMYFTELKIYKGLFCI
jgi:hypothetical protein